MYKYVPGKLRRFFTRYKAIVYKKGEIILRPEDEPQGVYYIKEGFVKLSTILEDGKELTFTLLGGHPVFGKLAQIVTVRDFDKVSISNSFGHREERYEVKLRVKIGHKTFKTTFTLANRESMVYPILLGRKLLNRRFLVDTANTGIDRLALKRLYDIIIPEEEEQKYENSDSIKRPR